MKHLKKIVALCLTLSLCLFSGLLTACSPSDRAAGQSVDVTEKNEIKIGIIQYMSHPSLDNCTTGIMQGLQTSPYYSKMTIDVQVGSSSSAESDCATYAGQMVAKNYDMIFAVATPAAMSTFAATEKIPVIFCAVSDPVAANLVKSAEQPYYNATGTSDVLDLQAQVNLIKTLQPDVQTIGILYTTSEANSISNLARMREIAQNEGLTIDAVGIQNESDIPAALTALCARVDCLNNFTDNNVVNNLALVLEAANAAGIPVYGSEVEQVKNGCLAAVSIDYVALGVVTGEMGCAVLAGQNPGEMAVRFITDATPVINTDVASALHITIPAAYENADKVTTNP